MTIAIIGAGLAGLTAAKVLHENNINFELYERSMDIGGRVTSIKKNDYILDKGFQVLLPNYPQIKKHIDISKLDLSYFSAGAKIFKDKDIKTIANPLSEPSYVLNTLSSKIGNFSDKIKILKLILESFNKNYGVKSSSKTITTLDFLKNYGFSDGFINDFFIPFFSGIYLNKDLKYSKDYFLFLFSLFSKSKVALPKKGMNEIAQALAESIPKEKIHLKTEVRIQESKTLEFQDGKTKNFQQIIIATDQSSACELLNKKEKLSFNQVQTTYFTYPKEFSYSTFLHLNANENRKINHIAFLSEVQESYSSNNMHIASVNSLNQVNENEIANELQELLGPEVKQWEHLDTHFIKEALPNISPMIKDDNYILAGDYTHSPSIQGAMYSGELAAYEVIGRM